MKDDSIRYVFTDLDNTVYNWVDYYGPAFRAMISEISEISGVSSEDLKKDFKRIHQRHGTSEYSFSIQELEVLPQDDLQKSTGELLDKYWPAIERFREVRDTRLNLYDGVEEALEFIEENGLVLIAYTDAFQFYAVNRLKKLGVESFYNCVVAPPDHGIPEGTAPEDVRSKSDPAKYEPSVPRVLELDVNRPKPHPRIFMKVLKELGAKPSECVFVGDSLYRDVYMAQKCGVLDVYAKYGTEHREANFETLVEISHWTKEEVQRARRADDLEIEPSHTLDSPTDLIQLLRRSGQTQEE